MLVKLSNDKLLLLQGEIKIEPYGITIQGLTNSVTISFSHIKWVYAGQDVFDEKKVQGMTTKRKPIEINTSEDLMKEFYK